MKKVPLIIKDLIIYLTTTDLTPELMGDMIDVEGLATINLEEKNIISLSFEVNASPLFAGVLTQEVCKFISGQKKYKLTIYNSYALVFNDEGVCEEVLFDEEAIEYHQEELIRSVKELELEEGGLNLKEDKNKDIENKVNSLLDKINNKGINSLSEDQKKFLNDYSKGKMK